MSDQSPTADRSTAADQPIRAEPSATIDQSTTCPLCAYTGDTERDVYTHLLTSHRKSAITSLLLECDTVRATR